MKVNELPSHQELGSIKVRVPKRYLPQMVELGLSMEVFIASAWHNGIWLKPTLRSIKRYPLSVEDPKEVLDWEVV